MIDLYGQAAQATIIDMRDYRSPDCLVVGGLADSAVTTASFGTLLDPTDTLRSVQSVLCSDGSFKYNFFSVA